MVVVKPVVQISAWRCPKALSACAERDFKPMPKTTNRAQFPRRKGAPFAIRCRNFSAGEAALALKNDLFVMEMPIAPTSRMKTRRREELANMSRVARISSSANTLAGKVGN